MNQASPTTPLPTIALVHGAFAESASWNGVISALQDLGYSTIAIANPLRSLQEDAAYVRSVLEVCLAQLSLWATRTADRS